MIILKIIILIVALAFLVFGYLIYFKKKYNLINGFEADVKAGRKNEAYAKCVGFIELVTGSMLLIAAILLFIFVK